MVDKGPTADIVFLSDLNPLKGLKKTGLDVKKKKRCGANVAPGMLLPERMVFVSALRHEHGRALDGKPIENSIMSRGMF